MARGWESKDVESQVQTNQSEKTKSSSESKSANDLGREQQRKDLQLSRTRIVNDLSAATNPNHRKSLEAALTYLDAKLSELK